METWRFILCDCGVGDPGGNEEKAPRTYKHNSNAIELQLLPRSLQKP